MTLLLDSVNYTYARGTGAAVDALADVTLSVAPGQMVLVLGATGSGKSTLLRLAAGLLEPSEGSATLDGVPLVRPERRRRVGLIFQDAESQLFADTLRDDVAFGPSNFGAGTEEAARHAAEAMAAVGLDPAVFGGRSPFTLSGGEARRAAIAGVLAMRPKYVLADEPTAGLDAAGRREIRKLLTGRRESAGVVVVSHSAEEFLGEADSVLVLADGRTAWTGAASALIEDPAPLAEAGLIAPDVLEVQRLARERGLAIDGFTLDPADAAQQLVVAAHNPAATPREHDTAGGWAR